MEPYRAYVSDRLERRSIRSGFLTQSAFTGLAQTLAYLAPSILVFLGMNKDAVNANHIPHITVAAFLARCTAVVHHGVLVDEAVPELPLTDAERTRFERVRAALLPRCRDRGRVPRDARHDAAAVVDEAVPVVRDDVLLDLHRPRSGALDVRHGRSDVAGLSRRQPAQRADRRLLQLRGLRRRVCDGAVHAPLGAKPVHAVCLVLAGLGMWAIPSIRDKAWLFVPMIGVGLAWASIMGNPYVLLASSIPPERPASTWASSTCSS
jgi:maltose/moltooligosaccharide transporter